MTELIEVLRSVPASYAVVIAVVAALLKAGKGLFEFHDEHLQKRPFKKLAFLAKESEGSMVLSDLVSAARNEEIFRSVFGRTASPDFMAAVRSLIATGKFSLLELRVSLLYLELVNGRIVVSLGTGAWFIFWAAISIVLLMGVYIAVLFTSLLRLQSVAAYLAVVILLAAYFLFSWFIGRDARAVYLARQVRVKIEELRFPPASSEPLSPRFETVTHVECQVNLPEKQGAETP